MDSASCSSLSSLLGIIHCVHQTRLGSSSNPEESVAPDLVACSQDVLSAAAQELRKRVQTISERADKCRFLFPYNVEKSPIPDIFKKVLLPKKPCTCHTRLSGPLSAASSLPGSVSHWHCKCFTQCLLLRADWPDEASKGVTGAFRIGRGRDSNRSCLTSQPLSLLTRSSVNASFSPGCITTLLPLTLQIQLANWRVPLATPRISQNSS